MRIGVVVPMSLSDGPGQVPTWPQVRAFGQHAEAVGLDSLWVCDHLLSGPPEGAFTRLDDAGRAGRLDQPGGAGPAGHLHLSSAPGAAGQDGHDRRHRQRRPAHPWSWAGWYDLEYQALGYPTDHRVGRFAEAIAILGPLLGGERVTLAGRWYQVRDAVVARQLTGRSRCWWRPRVGGCSG